MVCSDVAGRDFWMVNKNSYWMKARGMQFGRAYVNQKSEKGKTVGELLSETHGLTVLLHVRDKGSEMGTATIR